MWISSVRSQFHAIYIWCETFLFLLCYCIECSNEIVRTIAASRTLCKSEMISLKWQPNSFALQSCDQPDWERVRTKINAFTWLQSVQVVNWYYTIHGVARVWHFESVTFPFICEFIILLLVWLIWHGMTSYGKRSSKCMWILKIFFAIFLPIPIYWKIGGSDGD